MYKRRLSDTWHDCAGNLGDHIKKKSKPSQKVGLYMTRCCENSKSIFIPSVESGVNTKCASRMCKVIF